MIQKWFSLTLEQDTGSRGEETYLLRPTTFNTGRPKLLQTNIRDQIKFVEYLGRLSYPNMKMCAFIDDTLMAYLAYSSLASI